MDAKLAHLEMIQRTIDRMANHSFLLKGWSVTLIAAIIGFATKDSDPTFIIVAYFASVAFWTLDGFFLQQERLYRELFNEVRARSPEQIDFSMDTSKHKGRVSCLASICFSRTLLLFHATVFGSIVTVMLILWID